MITGCSVIHELNFTHAFHSSTAVFQEREELQTNSITMPEYLTDEALAQQIISGNSSLMAELVNRHSDRLFLIIRRMTPSRTVAEDVLQDTWLLVVRKFHQYDPSRPLIPWLTRIAMNCSRNYWRKERWRRFWRSTDETGESVEISDRSGEQELVSEDQRMDMDNALARLSVKLREVVVLKFYSGLTQDEIAEVLKIPSGTVKSRLHLALAKLRQVLEGVKVSV